ncbi:MAG: hypothetical protein ACRERU_11480, partial [Methylococcales bacterium]
RLGVLAYNLFQGFKHWALQKEWRQHCRSKLSAGVSTAAGFMAASTGSSSQAGLTAGRALADYVFENTLRDPWGK